MRRLIVLAAAALLVLAMVPLTSSATSTVTTKHVDGSIITSNPDPIDPLQQWIARFEVRTTPSGAVQFGYLELYGIGPSGTEVGGQIHEFAVDSVPYFKTASGAQGATLYMHEWRIVPWTDPPTTSPALFTPSLTAARTTPSHPAATRGPSTPATSPSARRAARTRSSWPDRGRVSPT